MTIDKNINPDNLHPDLERFWELAVGASGVVQAGRWTRIPGGGFIHSFNGPHSLFIDTLQRVGHVGRLSYGRTVLHGVPSNEW